MVEIVESLCESADLKPGEDTAIVAHMDTRRFIGTKTVTIFDDIPIARFIAPPLTTVRVPIAKLVPYAGEPLRPGLVRTHVVVIPGEDAGD